MVRTYRSKGLIAKAIVTRQGYAQPTLSANPPEAFDQALAIAQVRDPTRDRESFHIIVFRLFTRRCPVPISALREGYREFFAPMSKALARTLEGSVDELEEEERAAQAMLPILPRKKSGRYIEKRAKGSVDLQLSALTAMSAILLGHGVDHFAPGAEGDEDAVDEMLALTGLAGFSEDRTGPTGPIIDTYQEMRKDSVGALSMFSLSDLESHSQTASNEELVRGRELALVLLPYVQNVASNARGLDGVKDGFGLGFAETMTLDEESICVCTLLFVAMEKSLGAKQIDDSLKIFFPGTGGGGETETKCT
jgi:hypothetical protein